MTQIEIVEVGPRDGLQNEKALVSTADKVELIRRAVAAGARRIEVASFVHPARVPQMADAEAVCEAVAAIDAIKIGLVLNRRGAERALATCVDEIGAVVSASDGFAKANQGRNSDETVEDAIEILTMAHDAGRRAQVTISVAFGCPFDGEIAPERVAAIAGRLAEFRPLEIALGDTIGVAVPAQVLRVIEAVKKAAPGIPVRGHFHDTRNMAIANAWAAIGAGVRTLDASIGGLGGCPFAPGATGNLPTEDLVYMLQRSGIETGYDLASIIAANRWFEGPFGRALPARLSRVPPFPPEAPKDRDVSQ